jgi:putative nucleotidyltransferase with HDIG domain
MAGTKKEKIMSKILVVDDEKSLRITLSLFLESKSHTVETACNVDEAIEIVRTFQPDLVITDIVMPQKTGVELLQYLRDNDPDIQVIIMTGEPTVETAVQAVQLAANDYLSKPIRKGDFLRVIDRVLMNKQLIDDKKRLTEENERYQRNLEDTVERRTKALFKASESIIKLLAKVIEFRDPYTAGHQIRVGNLAAEIAKEMNLDSVTVEDIRIIGYIHDIGKISVPAEILSKPGALSPAERFLIQDHAACGYELLADVDLPSNYAEAVYQHHERYNGTGYPRKLHYGQILPETNIIAVADVVEAMTSHRPYRPALGRSVALEEIKSQRGTLYQPEVVDACLKLLSKDDFKLDSEPHKLELKLVK